MYILKPPPYLLSNAGLEPALDEMVVAAAIGDEIGDGGDLEAVELGEADEVRATRHGAVVVHDLADDAGRVEPGETRDVDRRLGMAGAHQHAAVARHQRKDVPGRHDDRSGPLLGSIAVAMVRARSGAEMPVVTPSRASIETVKAVRRREAFCCGMSGSLSCSTRCLGQGEADQAAAVLGHEVDDFRRRHLRRDDEIALVLAILVVDENEHPAVARFLDHVLDRRDDLDEAHAFHLCINQACRTQDPGQPIPAVCRATAALDYRVRRRPPASAAHGTGSSPAILALQQPGDVARQHVDLEIDAVADPRRAEAGAGLGMRE